MKKAILMSLCVLSIGSVSATALAAETVGEKIETGANKAGDSMKKGYRGAKDKTCHMVNGKMECAAKKMKHKMQNAGDSIGTKTTETKNEITK